MKKLKKKPYSLYSLLYFFTVAVTAPFVTILLIYLMDYNLNSTNNNELLLTRGLTFALILYLISLVGLWKRRKWAVGLFITILLATIILISIILFLKDTFDSYGGLFVGFPLWIFLLFYLYKWFAAFKREWKTFN